MLPTFAQYSGNPPNSGGDGGPTPTTDSQAPIRPTRKQVSRACDWCRARRIKCDNGRPCKACRQRDAQCTHKGTDEPRTLPQALREIDKLRARVRELQAELNSYKSKDSRPSHTIPTPTETSAATSSPSSTKDQRHSPQGSSSQPTSPSTLTTIPKPQWEGIYVATSRSEQTSYYGPSSHFYFVSRIGAYLNKALQQPCASRSMQPQEARRTVVLDNNDDADEGGGRPHSMAGRGRTPSMNRTQEEYFLGLFWESHHCFQPIIDEGEFRKHYASLWDPSNPYRKQSPLVDIVLAVCLQYGYTFMPRDTSSSSNRDASCDDATLAGRWYYRRCQSLLTADLESPTITTVQCLIFSIAYLCCASFQNMAHVTMAQALRTAQILGLQLEPPVDMPRGERELRKRIWWCLWTTEAKTSTKLGRPISVDRSLTTVTLPSDDLDAATANGATLGSYANITWLTYSVQTQKLVNTSFGIHYSLYAKCGEVLKKSGANSLYKDPQALESCAELLATKIPALKTWTEQVPPGIKTLRRSGGEPFSTDRLPLDIDPLAPTWVQRQRICLELMYHTQILYLSRPFIAFYSNSSTYTPLAERHATACVNHAIAHTLIMHQVVTETDLMSGWSEFFFWQWNATITISGFILAYPIHPSTPNARKALEKGVAVFDAFGANFCVAADAAKIIRNLLSEADLLAGRLRSGVTSSSGKDEAAASGGGVLNNNDDSLAWLDPSQQDDDPNYFSEFMDWALSVDQFNSFERFFDVGNPADPWQFGQWDSWSRG